MLKNSFKFSIGKLFLICLFITLLLSLYIFVQAIFCNIDNYKCLYSTWQFPMLFALFMESVLLEYKIN